MKKFIIFCLILIVTVSLGVTVYYFMRDNEELVVNAEPYIYVNKGDLVEVDAELKHAKVGNEVVLTSLNPSVLEWNPALNGFEAIEGGAAVIEVRTKNDKISAIYIEVSIGNGMKEAPYYIDSEEDLTNIGKEIFTSTSYYILKQDISLSTNFTPILSNGTFSGNFNGNGYTISGLTIETAEGVANAGLFAKLGETGVVTNLTLTGVNINGQFASAGAVAGVNLGTIHRCEVLSGSVTSTLQNANVGGIAGIVEYSNNNVGRIDRCYSNVSVSGTLNVGGLVGVNNGAIVINSYVKHADSTEIRALANGANIGGLIGLNINKEGKTSTTKNCYAKATITIKEGVDAQTVKQASLIGYNDEISAQRANNLMGLYADNSSLAVANHEFTRTFIANETAQEINFRGLHSSFPKDSNNLIISADLISYVAKTLDGQERKNWDFANVWLIDANTGYPVLNKQGADVPDDIASSYDPSIISTADDLMALANSVNNGEADQYYILENDIDLNNADFTPIGTNSKPFNGTFEGNGKTIKGLKIAASTIQAMGEGNNKMAGLFGKISSSAIVKNFTIENVSIADGATYAGAVVAYNEGLIQNTTVTQVALNKEVKNITGTYAVGGIAGLSLGTVENCKVTNQTVNVSALSNGSSRYLGGIVGLNGLENNSATATVKGSSVVKTYIYDSQTGTAFPEEFRLKKGSRDYEDVLTTAYFYVGGIAGANFYEITNNYTYLCDVKVDNYSNRGLASGIVGFSKSSALLANNRAELSYNKVQNGTISGCVSSGLVGYLYGIAKYNHVEADTIYGLIVGGLANDIKIDARLNNCFSKSHLVNFKSGNFDNGSAGITNLVRYQSSSIIIGFQNEYYGEFTQIFTTCTFESTNLSNMYDSHAFYRSEQRFLYDVRMYGFGNYVIFVETGHAKWQDEIFKTRQNNVYSISDEQAKLMIDEANTITLFTNNGFDTEHWAFETTSYPTIIGLPEVVENEE